jgi:death on curing protein
VSDQPQPEVVYLEVDDLIEAHAAVLGCSLVQAKDELRSPEGLDGAAARPRWHANYGGDLATQAAALAHGVAEGQFFIDGNKRTALVAMLTFLFINGFELDASQPERAASILELGRGGSIEDLATRLRKRLRSRT